MNELNCFEIVESPHGLYRFVIFAKSAINPLSAISSIEEELTHRAAGGSVLFDLFLSNGETSNRYISAFFDGKRFYPETFQIVHSLPREFKKIASSYYMEYKMK